MYICIHKGDNEQVKILIHTLSFTYSDTHVSGLLDISAHQSNFQAGENLCSNLHRKNSNSHKNMTQMEQSTLNPRSPNSMYHNQHFGRVL